MNAIEILAIVALTTYAVYKQTHVSEVREKGRFKLALIYGIVGISVGGFAVPHGAFAVVLLVTSVVLSIIVGLARGYLTRLWVDSRRPRPAPGHRSHGRPLPGPGRCEVRHRHL